ncbi:hypothetical protein [Streptomyces sp. NPDC058739]|uniref:hypothetical protein n=1 Tax=Streptomyces sp. NPDC058739 TaxID=3346618 RepID=UPI00369F43B0
MPTDPPPLPAAQPDRTPAEPAADPPAPGARGGAAPAPRPSAGPRDQGGDGPGAARPRFPSLHSRPRPAPATSRPGPPPPAASARFPDIPPRPGTAPGETREETTTRLRPVPAQPPAAQAPAPPRPWSAPSAPAPDPAPAPSPAWAAPAPRPVVTFGLPEMGDDRPRAPRGPARTVAAAACVVLGLGLIGGAVAGSWLVGSSAEERERSTFTAAGDLWHNVPVDRLFPAVVQGTGAGPGGADRTWIRIAVAPDSGCAEAFDPLLRKALAPVGCERLLRATYTDATQSHVTTVGLLFTDADASSMRSLDRRFDNEDLDERTDLMPRPYAAEGTVAARFGVRQRASWTVSVLTDAPVVVYAVSGWADARTVDDPEPAGDATRAGAAEAPAQAGLGHEAQGLADRIERGLRKDVARATEQPS